MLTSLSMRYQTELTLWRLKFIYIR